jgi:phosphoenolpyruvate-protein phosphotransferase
MKLQGIGAAPSLALGQAVVWQNRDPSPGTHPAAGAGVERARLAAAIQASYEQLESLATSVAAAAGDKQAQILRVQQRMLEDPMLMDAVGNAIEREGVSAEHAVASATSDLAAQFRGLADSYLRERAADVEDLGRRLLDNLTGAPRRPASGIVVARNLAPSDVGLLAQHKALGLVTEEGGPAGHMAILARELGLAAVVGAMGAVSRICAGDLLAVDGVLGEVIINPDKATLAAFDRRLKEQHARQAQWGERKHLPAVTRDGFRVQVAANIGAPNEVERALDAGADGIGLFRTEYLFMGRAEPPSEDEQYEAYRNVLARMAPRRVMVRTADIGSDKPAAGWELPAEPNPALGMRGIRLALARPELFRCQLRALVRAAGAGNLGLMLPMVSSVSEVRQARALLDVIQGELGIALPISLGVMVETPAAALLAAELAVETDFLSIGTNDLTQYVLAVDRLNPAVAAMYQPLHPAVLRMMRTACDAALRAGRRVGVCGEMAADPQAAPLLIAMGVSELSMAPTAIPAVKDAVRRIYRNEAEARLP